MVFELWTLPNDKKSKNSLQDSMKRNKKLNYMSLSK